MYLRCIIFFRSMWLILRALAAGIFSYCRQSSYFGTDTNSSQFGFKVYVADAMMQGNQTERSVLHALDILEKLKLELSYL